MKLTILVLEDEPEVRDAIERDLAELASVLRIEPAEDVPDAWEVIEEITRDGDLLALVLADHRLPGTTGVDFLVELVRDERAAWARTVLLTGQADQQDTIRALNQAGLSHYLAKPWDRDELLDVVRTSSPTSSRTPASTRCRTWPPWTPSARWSSWTARTADCRLLTAERWAPSAER